MPIWHNPDFTLLTFQQLIDTYDIRKQQYLQCIQLKHLIKAKMDTSSIHLEQPPLLDNINKITK